MQVDVAAKVNPTLTQPTIMVGHFLAHPTPKLETKVERAVFAYPPHLGVK